MSRPDVSILIVTYRNPELTAACLDSVFSETRDVTFEVLAHDNESGDGTPEMIAERFPRVDLSRDRGNLGFARANNLLARKARGDYLLLLNPDTVVLDGAVQRLVEEARRHPRAVPLGVRTLRPDGSLDPNSCWAEPTLWSMFCFATGLSTVAKGNGFFDPESIGGWARDSFRRVGIVSGCCALLPRDAWERLGGFDETYWLYGEDWDLSMRATARGFYPAVTPVATITHVLGASSVRGDKTVLVLRSKVTLMRKHWSRLRAAVGVRLLVAGVFLRVLLELAARRPTEQRHWTFAMRHRKQWVGGF